MLNTDDVVREYKALSAEYDKHEAARRKYAQLEAIEDNCLSLLCEKLRVIRGLAAVYEIDLPAPIDPLAEGTY